MVDSIRSCISEIDKLLNILKRANVLDEFVFDYKIRKDVHEDKLSVSLGALSDFCKVFNRFIGESSVKNVPLSPYKSDVDDEEDSKNGIAKMEVGDEADDEVLTADKSQQTVDARDPALLPMPVPFYVPTPVHMFTTPYPVPVPVPLPVPVPIFIPTTRNSIRGIMKQIRKIRIKLPGNQFEADMLAMAGALVGDGRKDPCDSDDSPWEDDDMDYDGEIAPVVNRYPPEDMEHNIGPNKVVPKPLPLVTTADGAQPHLQQHHPAWQQQQQQQQQQQPPRNKPRPRPRPRSKPASFNIKQEQQNAPVYPQPPKERPDAKNHLKFTYGINAWKHWVVQKNAEIEKARASGKYMKAFETDILKLRADELNYTLCMFVKEVKKPNGDAYAPDSVFYLVLGIQEYLFENGRIENIFMDQYYEPFTSALHDVVKDFKLPKNSLGYFVTRIEEEHLWEAKQLGVHSPQVLLNTLIYYNTNYFLLRSNEEHSKLSFPQIMKHWKKTDVPGRPGIQEKKVFLRYYPPQVKGQRSDGKKCYEQMENLQNPIRCPVKLYDFYLSKCPESMKSRNDLFYLQPERSCVPDSPVWYSSQPLNQYQLDKMLQRLLMTKEVQEHMLADQP